jgi:hypothetical protein
LIDSGLAVAGLRRALGRLLWGTSWRRRTTSIVLVVAVQAAVLGITYRAVLVQDRTLLTGSSVYGTEGVSPPYGYPGPPLTSSNEIDAGASAWQFVPQIEKAHMEVSAGELPLWNANLLLGAPLAAEAQTGLFNPLAWPLIASPTPGTWDAWLLVRLLMAGLLCSLLAWYLGLRLLPSTVAGLIFMMSGVFQLRTTTIQTSVMVMLPLVVMAVEACIRRPSRWSSGLLGLAIALSILAGMPEESFICLGFAAVYFVVRFAVSWRGKNPFPRFRGVYAALGGALVGVLLSLPLLIPFAEYVGVAVTQHGAGSTIGLVAEHAHELLSLIGPHWNVIGHQSGDLATEPPVDNWFGVGAILLALLGLGATSLPRSTRVLLAVSAVAVEAKTVGLPGFFNQIVGEAPVLSRIAFWAYGGVIVSLCVALLAGAGLQRFELKGVSFRQVAIATLVVLGAIAVGAPSFLDGTQIRWDQLALTAAVLTVVAGAAVYSGRSAGSHRTWSLVAAGAAVAVELTLLASPELTLPLNYNPLSSTPTTAYLERVDPSGTGRTYSATAILYPTTNTAFDLDDVRDLDALYVDRTYEYIKLFVAPGITDRFDGLPPNTADYVDNPFFDALNVEYILVAPPLSQNGAELPADQFTLATVTADGVGIYRNLDAAPRAQVVFDTSRAGSESDAIAQMSAASFDPMTEAVVEAGASVQVPSDHRAPVPASIETYRDDEVVMRTTTSEPGTLVLADAYYPGWVAEVDGRPAPIYATDLALRGVMVPAGTHTIVMRYEPASVAIGALGVPSGAAVWVIGGWGVPVGLRLVRRRRRPRGHAVAAEAALARPPAETYDGDDQVPPPPPHNGGGKPS